MSNEKKQEFTLRISNANKTSLCVILYDMFDVYIDEAMEAAEIKDNRGKVSCDYRSAYHTDIRRARNVLSELIDSVNRGYGIGENLYQIYRFVERELIKADIRETGEGLDEVKDIMIKLRDSYDEICKQDESGSVMSGASTVYAGMTYGRNDISESANIEYNRGFLA